MGVLPFVLRRCQADIPAGSDRGGISPADSSVASRSASQVNIISAEDRFVIGTRTLLKVSMSDVFQRCSQMLRIEVNLRRVSGGHHCTL
jgi:hypothetical protein